jgi:hypothetical protein
VTRGDRRDLVRRSLGRWWPVRKWRAQWRVDPRSDACDSYPKARLAYCDGDWLNAAAQASVAIAHDAGFGAENLTRAAAAGMAIAFNEDASETRLAEMKRDLQQAARLVGTRDAMFTAVDAKYASTAIAITYARWYASTRHRPRDSRTPRCCERAGQTILAFVTQLRPTRCRRKRRRFLRAAGHEETFRFEQLQVPVVPSHRTARTSSWRPPVTRR